MNRESMLIEPGELLARLGHDDLRIFDASVSDAAYREGHIPGAAFFDHDAFSDPDSPYGTTLLDIDRLNQRIGASGISADSEVVVYACGVLPYAARAWWVLHYAGHDRVRVLNGGLAAWQAAGGQVEQVARTYPPTTFSGRSRPAVFAAKEEVLAALANSETAVIDVLPLASYEATHITGSSSLSCLDLMQGMDAFLPVDALAARLSETRNHKRLITYCGGGIAAALSAMAHVMVGQTDVAVYDGSLDEWIGEGLPVTGDGDWQIWKRQG